jgi:hypothetical protein
MTLDGFRHSVARVELGSRESITGVNTRGFVGRRRSARTVILCSRAAARRDRSVNFGVAEALRIGREFDIGS